MFNPFAIRRETGGAVKPVNGTVKRCVRGPQVGGHQIRVIKIGEGGVGVGGAGVQHGLTEGIEFGGGESGGRGKVNQTGGE